MARRRQLRVKVLQRGGAPEAIPFIEDMTRRIVPKMFSTRMANTLSLRIELRSSKMKSSTNGQAFHADIVNYKNKQYTIIIQRDLLPTQMAKTLAHELAHIKQYTEGRLRPGRQGGEMGRFWKPTREGAGQFWPYATTDYWTSPWEVEARELSALGSEAMKERMAEGNAAAANGDRRMQLEHLAIQENAGRADFAKEINARGRSSRRVLGVRI
jgi:hypothetical protein